jgi:hypothetical protein
MVEGEGARKHLNRRSFLAGVGEPGSCPGRPPAADRLGARPGGGAAGAEAAGLTSPVIIDSIRLLSRATSISCMFARRTAPRGVVAQSTRADYLDKILKTLVIPAFIGKDARDLEDLLWQLYRTRDNYKLYGIALWCPQAWVEFAILDMLGGSYASRWEPCWATSSGARSRST